VVSWVFSDLSNKHDAFILVKASQTLPIGTAYAVRTGIGTVLVGIFVFKE